MVTISMPLPLFSTSSTYSEKNKNNLNISRHQARRISLPNTLNNQQRNGGGEGGLRSPRSRTPNSLSPKIGFLKEISEFDIDPPFISPGASSSSSADNSHCNSPMLLSPFSHRPSSARPYRRNKLNNNNQNLQLKSKIQDENDLNNKSIQRRNIQSMRAARRSEPFIFGNPEELANDDFKWTDVDGFYGRKNSIPLHQLLANDLTILKGIHAKNNEQTNNGNTPPCGTIKQLKLSQQQQQQQQFNDFSVNSDDNEIIENKEEINSSEDSLKIGKFKKRQKTQRNSLEEIKKSSSAPMSSPTKRRLKLIKNKLYSLEDDKKGIKIEIEEKDNNYLLEIENQEKIKINELLNEKEDNDDVLLLRQILKSKKQPIQQFRQFNVEQNGQRIIDNGVKTIRSKIYSQPTIS
ncbi:hypothetical protein Mgra_00001459 [Meloidogyne graminicola]|uniref:Uncharacterized protein n=1 Tax=Meloidogyne graminicola TaxID=189291 RepID=A0A8S9ZZ71_9BILA|nr:hypothetical protein Mgra_00001459 [Meloidogyne graminicola]